MAGVKGVEFYNPPFFASATTTPGSPVKFIIDNWFLILAALTSGGLLLWPVLSRGAGRAGLTPSEAVMLINREKAQLIDVSEPAQFAAGHAAGAKNVPFASLQTAGDLPKNKALPLVVLCQNGARASRAAAILRKLGHENCRFLAGGFPAWRDANLPVEKKA